MQHTMKIFRLLAILLTVFPLCAHSLQVAIIGGGISGTSTAYFLRQLFNHSSASHLSIDLYEQSSHLGGRIHTISYKLSNGSLYTIEAGGSILHASNHYMKSFAALLNLTTIEPQRINRRLGIFDGVKFLLKTTNWSLYNFAAILWRYKWSLFSLISAVDRVAQKFSGFYPLQAVDTRGDSAGNSYETVEELLDAVGLYNLTQISLENWLNEELGENSLISQELIPALVRVNYNQNVTINALAGAVAIIPMSSPRLFTVKEGNQRIPELLAQNFADNMYLRHKITEIQRINSETGLNRPELRGLDADQLPFHRAYDVIIIAAPLELAKIQLNWPISLPNRKFQRTVASFIKARVRRESFGLEEGEELPSTALTIEKLPNIPFSSIGSYVLDRNLENSKEGSDSERELELFKVFSREILNETTLNQMFLNLTAPNSTANSPSNGRSSNISADIYDWLAYPQFNSTERFGPFVLEKGVYYVSAFENSVSCMESMAVAAKNVALLVKKHYGEKQKAEEKGQTSEEASQRHSEL
jgi:prenylcysteine oxidase/farnesylcysteine lyase